MRVIFDVLRDGLRPINTAAEQMAEARQQVSSGRRMLVAERRPARHAAGGRRARDARHHRRLSRVGELRRRRGSRPPTASSTAIVDKITAAIVAGDERARVEGRSRRARRDGAGIRGLRDSLVADFNTKFNGSALFAGTATAGRRTSTVGGAGPTRATRRPCRCRSITAGWSR